MLRKMATGVAGLASVGLATSAFMTSSFTAPEERKKYGFGQHYTPNEFKETDKAKLIAEKGFVYCGKMYDRGDDKEIGPKVRDHYKELARAHMQENKGSIPLSGAAEGGDIWSKEEAIMNDVSDLVVLAPNAEAKDFFMPNIFPTSWTLVTGFDGPDAQGYGGKWTYRDIFQVGLVSAHCRKMKPSELLAHIRTGKSRIFGPIEKDAAFYSMGTSGNVLYHFTGIPGINLALKGLSSSAQDKPKIIDNIFKAMNQAGASGNVQFVDSDLNAEMAAALYGRLEDSRVLVKKE